MAYVLGARSERATFIKLPRKNDLYFCIPKDIEKDLCFTCHEISYHYPKSIIDD